MSRFSRIRRVRRILKRKQRIGLAFLGDENGNIRARIGKVWVRFPGGVDEDNNVLFSQAIPVNPGTGYPEFSGSPVRVAYDEHDELYIKKADEKELRASDFDLRMINPGNTQNKYFLLRHATRLMCRAVGNKTTSSALAGVQSWIYQDSYGDLSHFVGTPTQADKPDIVTDYTPTATNHRVIVVFFRMIDQTLQIYGSTEQDQDTALDMTDYQECFVQSYIDEDVPIQAFKLADAQAVIDNRDLGVDLRMFLQGQPRFGEENPVTHNRVLRSGQTEFVSGLNVIGEMLILGEVYDLQFLTEGVSSSSGGADSAYNGARVYHNANQSIANGTNTILALNSERYDTNTYHDTVTNNSRLTAPVTGKYLVTAHIDFASNATGVRAVRIKLNGGTFYARWSVGQPPSGTTSDMSISTVMEMSATDYVEIEVRQSSGGALNVLSSGNWSPEFTITYLGA